MEIIVTWYSHDLIVSLKMCVFEFGYILDIFYLHKCKLLILVSFKKQQ